MGFLDGYKTYITAGAIALVTAALYLGMLTKEQADIIYGGLAAFGLYAVRDGIKKATPILIAVLGLGFMASSSPALAKDCSFGDGDLDAKVFKAGFPAAVGFDLALADFEVGIFRKGDFACASATANPLGLVCMIPKVGGVLEGIGVCSVPFKDPS